MEEDPLLTPRPWWAPGYRSFRPRGRAAAAAVRVLAALCLLVTLLGLLSWVHPL